MKWDFGTILKEIRKSKGLSQSEVCGNALSRTTLSKIENNKEYPSIHHFAHILRQLNMTFAEFDYICHAYKPSERSRIIKKYESLGGSRVTSSIAEEFLQMCRPYLKKHEDIRIQRLEQQMELVLSICQTGDGERTKQLAHELWQDLEKSDTWYLNDFRKLNLILPIIPVEQLGEFVDKILLSLDKYKDFKDINVSQFAFLYNLSTVLLRNEEYALCISVMEKVYDMAQESMRIDYLSLSNVRIGLLTGNEKQINKWLSVLQVAEMTELLQQLEEDVQTFWGIHLKIEEFTN